MKKAKAAAARPQRLYFTKCEKLDTLPKTCVKANLSFQAAASNLVRSVRLEMKTRAGADEFLQLNFASLQARTYAYLQCFLLNPIHGFILLFLFDSIQTYRVFLTKSYPVEY